LQRVQKKLLTCSTTSWNAVDTDQCSKWFSAVSGLENLKLKNTRKTLLIRFEISNGIISDAVHFFG
jgi:hypothetical protein